MVLIWSRDTPSVTTLVSLSSMLKDLLGPVPRAKKKRRGGQIRIRIISDGQGQIMAMTLGPYAVQIWSRDTPSFGPDETFVVRRVRWGPNRVDKWWGNAVLMRVHIDIKTLKS